jgi:hypothetical protein
LGKSKLFTALRLNSRGTSEFFKVYDEFYIPGEYYSPNLFQKSIAISTRHGFELFSLDKKAPVSIPDLKRVATTTSGAPLAG